MIQSSGRNSILGIIMDLIIDSKLAVSFRHESNLTIIPGTCSPRSMCALCGPRPIPVYIAVSGNLFKNF